MQSGLTEFTPEQIEEMLNEDGFAGGTKSFNEERDRRYCRSEINTALYVERSDWDGVRRKAWDAHPIEAPAKRCDAVLVGDRSPTAIISRTLLETGR